jgi:hypothetical protein
MENARTLDWAWRSSSGKVRITRRMSASILNQLVAEKASDRYSSTSLHLVSVFGGDQEIGAIGAAAAEEQRFHVEAFGEEFIGTLGEKPISYRASIPVSGRKRRVRHLVLISKSCFETTLGSDASAKRTVLYDRLAAHFIPDRPRCPFWALPFCRNGRTGSTGNCDGESSSMNSRDSTVARSR